jgi:hypothetical protein
MTLSRILLDLGSVALFMVHPNKHLCPVDTTVKNDTTTPWTNTTSSGTFTILANNNNNNNNNIINLASDSSC